MSPVDVVVDDRLRIDARTLTDAELQLIKEQFEHKNPERAKLKAMGVAAWRGEPEFYRTWTGGPGALTLPRGGTGRLRAILGKRLVFRDKRAYPSAAIPAHQLTFRGYQEEASDVILAKENCIVRAPTGAGKTVIAIGTMSRIRTPSLVVVWNSALLKQWRSDLAFQLGIREKDVGHIQGGKVRLAPVTVAMQQTMWKLDDRARGLVRSYFGALFMDEVHKCAARTFMDVVDWMPARYRVGLTADVRRKDRREFLIHDLFGKVEFDVAAESLEEDGAILDVEVRVVPTGLEAEWFKSEDRQAHARLLEQITWDDARTELAARIVEGCVREGKQTIAFSHRREHCERLRAAISHRGIPCGLMLGGPSDAPELERAIKGLRDGSMKAAVGTVQAIGTGIDLPSVSRGVIATPLASNKQLWGQVRGRLCRSADGKTDAVAYYLHDESPLGDTPVRMLARWNRSCEVITAPPATLVESVAMLERSTEALGRLGTALDEMSGMMLPAKDWIASRAPVVDRMLEGLGAALAATERRE